MRPLLPSSSLALTAGIMEDFLLLSDMSGCPSRYRSAIFLSSRKAWRRSLASSMWAISRPLTLKYPSPQGATSISSLSFPTARGEPLHRGASPQGQGLDRFPIRLACGHFTGSRLPAIGSQRHFRDAIGNDEFRLGRGPTCATETPGAVSMSVARPSGNAITASSVTTRSTRRVAVIGNVHFFMIFGAPLAVCCMATTTRLAPHTKSMAPPIPGTIFFGIVQLARSPD